MKPIKTTFSLIVLGFLASTSTGQVQIDQTFTPEQLVQQFLLGDGVEVFNVTFNGMPGNQINNQICRFLGPSNFIGFPEGIAMVSGPVEQIVGQFGPGPNPFISGDPDLFAIANVGNTNFSVNDCAILEFDFIPNGDAIDIRFVFMSQEYPSYTCSSFNDPFAFFLSGPGLSGPYSNNAVNIALVPNSNTPIGVNTINGGVPTGGGTASNCFNANPNWIADSQYYLWNNPPAAGDVQFPGMTTTITGSANVVCGEMYHIKLAIADASDGALDSAVFIEAGSFSSSGYSVTFNTSLSENGSAVVYEACEPVTLTLTKGGCSSSDVDTLFLSISGTAIPGIDYEPLPPFVVFEDGSSTVTIDVSVFADLLIEGVETIVITIQFINNQGELTTAEATLLIFDYIPMSLSLSDFTVPCPGDPVTIPAGVSGGAPPYQYLWSTGSTNPSITVNIPQTTTYSVTVTDYCGFIVQGSSIATLIDWPPFVVSNQTFTACPGAPVAISPSVSGGSNALGYTYNWAFGSNESNPTVTVSENTTFNVQVSDQCETLPAVITVEVIPFIPFQIQIPDEACGGSTGQYAILGDNPVITSIISEPEGFSFLDGLFSAPTTGGQSSVSYDVIAVDNCGNTNSAPIVVVGCDTTVPNIFSPNGDGVNDYFLIDGLVNFSQSRMQIFNRWGQLVYDNENYGRNNGEYCESPDTWKGCWWDGADLSDGVYFYIFSRSDGYEESGYVHVVRK
jgi:gliding motility-associated-like protein